MKNRRFRWCFIVLIWLCSSTLFADDTGSAIMADLAKAQRHTSSAMELRMTLIDGRDEQRVRTLQTLSLSENGQQKSITVFLSPAAVKNTRFLTFEYDDKADDQWIYLPSLGKVKRIAASERSGSFMGSDFTYADMASTTYDVDEATHTCIKEETYQQAHCLVIESIPNDGSDYGKTITWVDRDRLVDLKVEFYDKSSDELLKTLECSAIDYVSQSHIARHMVMTDAKGNHRTLLEILQIRIDIPINPNYFTVSFLETGRL